MSGPSNHVKAFFPNYKNFTALSGGDINSVYQVEDHSGERWCLKVNSEREFPGMFEAEKKGLELLENAQAFEVPQELSVLVSGELSALKMRYISQGEPMDGFSTEFAKSLHLLHSCSQPTFGSNHDNYIGSLPQQNSPTDSWPAFFIERRIEPMVVCAFDQGLIEKRWLKGFEHFYAEVKSLFPTCQPSLLHGDLWSGNYLINSSGMPVLFDPAAYFGHPEMDLGMMSLFGGFDHEIFRVYAEQSSLEDRWKERLWLTQLYPLLVHLNLFGRSYWLRIENSIKPFL